MGVYEEAKYAHDTLLGLLPTAEAIKHQTWYNAKMLNHDEFIDYMNRVLGDVFDSDVVEIEGSVVAHDNDNGNEVIVESHNSEIGDEIIVEPHDSISNVPSNVQTTQKSTASKASKKSSTSSARIKAEAEKAALMARAAALTEMHALERL